jgi:alginate O-acetyltransferase complex protein AlgI
VIFTSYTYIAFLTFSFAIYWALPVKLRKPFLIVASYAFYCSWDWRFSFLLLGVSVFNWAYGKHVLARSEGSAALWLGIIVNLIPLIAFKYTNFILQNLGWFVQTLGASWQAPVLDIVLVLGISFFSFQGIAYLVDISAGSRPFDKLADFMLFKAFWPQLIAGPIIRSDEIREQIDLPRTIEWSDVSEGFARISAGFFKKVVLADNIAPYVDMVFAANAQPNFLDATVGAIGFGMQIYFDFSAYSDIAIGSARLLGFRFPENFDWPYTASSPRDFWNRWHMSLSRWIKDYVFLPLSFASRHRPWMGPIWLILAMVLCGLWHGAAWTFIIWGAWHGLLLAINQMTGRRIFPERSSEVGRMRLLAGMLVTWAVVHVGWVFFRAVDVGHAMAMLSSIATFRGGLAPAVLRESNILFIGMIFSGLIAIQILRAWVRPLGEALGRLTAARLAWRTVRTTAILVMVIVFDREAQAFVYFQF